VWSTNVHERPDNAGSVNIVRTAHKIVTHYLKSVTIPLAGEFSNGQRALAIANGTIGLEPCDTNAINVLYGPLCIVVRHY
jgi:hypothetical protein